MGDSEKAFLPGISTLSRDGSFFFPPPHAVGFPLANSAKCASLESVLFGFYETVSRDLGTPAIPAERSFLATGRTPLLEIVLRLPPQQGSFILNFF